MKHTDDVLREMFGSGESGYTRHKDELGVADMMEMPAFYFVHDGGGSWHVNGNTLQFIRNTLELADEDKVATTIHREFPHLSPYEVGCIAFRAISMGISPNKITRLANKLRREEYPQPRYQVFVDEFGFPASEPRGKYTANFDETYDDVFQYWQPAEHLVIISLHNGTNNGYGYTYPRVFESINVYEEWYWQDVHWVRCTLCNEEWMVRDPDYDDMITQAKWDEKLRVPVCPKCGGTLWTYGYY